MNNVDVFESTARVSPVYIFEFVDVISSGECKRCDKSEMKYMLLTNTERSSCEAFFARDVPLGGARYSNLATISLITLFFCHQGRFNLMSNVIMFTEKLARG